MSNGLIIASNTNMVLTEVHTGLLEAFNLASNNNSLGDKSLEIAALAKELRKYERLMHQQPQTSAGTENMVLTKIENKLLEAFKEAPKSNANGNKSFGLVALAKEIRKYECDQNKQKRTAEKEDAPIFVPPPVGLPV